MRRTTRSSGRRRAGERRPAVVEAEAGPTKDDADCGGEPPPLPPTFKNKLGMEFVLVPRGKSWLGGGGGKPGDKEVEITHDFYLGKYEVTQEEWQKVMGSNPSVSRQCQAGQRKTRSGSRWRMCRGTTRRCSCGRLNDAGEGSGLAVSLAEGSGVGVCLSGRADGGPIRQRVRFLPRASRRISCCRSQANFGTREGLKRTCKVGSYQPNRLGLYDMHGNVWELCLDAHPDPRMPFHRRMRGGAWQGKASGCRAAHFFGTEHYHKWDSLGMRVARIPAGKEKK